MREKSHQHFYLEVPNMKIRDWDELTEDEKLKTIVMMTKMWRAGYDQKDIAENVGLHRIQSNHLIAKYIMTDKELEDIYKELDEDFKA
jgi:hypothetical protein